MVAPGAGWPGVLKKIIMKVDESIKLIVGATVHPDGKQLRSQYHETINGGKYAYDGHHLNGFDIQVTLDCQKDFDDLIHLLQIHKKAFTK